jgi:hypothetical protein
LVEKWYQHTFYSCHFVHSWHTSWHQCLWLCYRSQGVRKVWPIRTLSQQRCSSGVSPLSPHLVLLGNDQTNSSNWFTFRLCLIRSMRRLIPVTGYGLEGSGSIPGRGRDYSSPLLCPQRLPGTLSFLSDGYWWLFVIAQSV